MQGHELRVEVDWNKQIHITIKEGSAEIFGTALQLGEVTTIQGQKIAIFTWKGCTLDIKGSPDVIYQSDDTCMHQYLNVHEVLQARRTAASTTAEEGPRVMIVGPTDVGKSTVCKILLNYAVRAGSCPAFVDLDIGQGSITVPGCLAATPVEAPIDVQAGVSLDAPLVYYFGNVTPSDNPDLYKHLVERLAAVLDKRSAESKESRTSGLIINSMGWVEDLGYDLVKHAVHALKADVVLVVGQERLYSQLTSEYGKNTADRAVSVVKVAKSPGVVTRSREHRITARKARVEEYFYGHRKEFSPSAQTASIEELEVYKVGGGPKAPTTALPIGAASVTDPLKVTRVVNFKDLLFTMVAVSHAASADLLLSSNVAGFVYIQDVDATQGTVTFLAPTSGQLPSKLLLGGVYKTYLD